MLKNWTITTTEMPREVHVLPNSDLARHITSRNCECLPRVEELPQPAPFVVIHNALDNREFDEIAEIINNGE